MERILTSIFLVLFLFSECKSSFSAIERNDVEKIIIWTHESEREASANEISSILKFYNAADYDGKVTGEGGTPDFGLRIVLKNKDEILVNDFHGKVEVSVGNQAFYLKSQDLYATIEEAASLANQS